MASSEAFEELDDVIRNLPKARRVEALRQLRAGDIAGVDDWWQLGGEMTLVRRVMATLEHAPGRPADELFYDGRRYVLAPDEE